MDNLTLYNSRLEELTPGQKEVFPSCFIGAVSALIADGDWEIALAAAEKMAKTIRPEREATVRDITSRRKP